MSNVYLISHFHDYEKIFSAYCADASKSKVLILENSIKDVFIESGMICSQIKTYDVKKFYLNYIFLYFSNRKKSPANLYLNSLMGYQNIYPFAFFDIKNIFYTNDLIHRDLILKKNYSPIELLIKIIFFMLSKKSLVKYSWRNYSALGLNLGSFFPIKTSYYLPKIEHKYDAIFLDIGSHLGVDLPGSAERISNLLSSFGNPAIKKHPSFDWGIGNYLDFPKIEYSIPVESFEREDVTLIYLISSAAQSFNKKVNVLNLLKFMSVIDKEKVFRRVQEDIFLYSLNNIGFPEE